MLGFLSNFTGEMNPFDSSLNTNEPTSKPAALSSVKFVSEMPANFHISTAQPELPSISFTGFLYSNPAITGVLTRSTVLSAITVGAVYAAISPLSNIATLLQTSDDKKKKSGLIIKETIEKKGIQSLWAGAAYNLLKRLLFLNIGTNAVKLSQEKVSQHLPNTLHLPAQVILAAALETIVTAPLEMRELYKNFLKQRKDLVPLAQYLSAENYKKLAMPLTIRNAGPWWAALTLSRDHSESSSNINLIINTIFKLFIGVMVGFTTTPIDVIIKRMAFNAAQGKKVHNMTAEARIVSIEGLRSFFKGVEPRICIIPISIASTATALWVTDNKVSGWVNRYLAEKCEPKSLPPLR
jgi:hypothetical protein